MSLGYREAFFELMAETKTCSLSLYTGHDFRLIYRVVWNQIVILFFLLNSCNVVDIVFTKAEVKVTSEEFLFLNFFSFSCFSSHNLPVNLGSRRVHTSESPAGASFPEADGLGEGIELIVFVGHILKGYDPHMLLLSVPIQLALSFLHSSLLNPFNTDPSKCNISILFLTQKEVAQQQRMVSVVSSALVEKGPWVSPDSKIPFSPQASHSPPGSTISPPSLSSS
mmetsp:Transcript_13986/g.22142  ORF Transcript_13986/g.22142 Transcript_13986/m.22142 type:complete len:224 (-) Transcript_13986:2700-3371(-)